ncbi:M48 family metalloprotease [Candidatus Daviesbacteria bacterium]|nr:M48 family metalloprotease [Candidatus Daviesbacteria bacterium]
MAVELSEISPQPSIKSPISLERWKNREQLTNEFGNTNIPVLKPFKSVNVSVETVDQSGNPVTTVRNFDTQIEKSFQYYSRTRNLEVNTPRTQILQNLVDKMTNGTGIQTRVIIMNKGKESNAFVTPDGTIFISQAIINDLGSLDEIGAILAHEVGHLYIRTFEHKVQAGSFSEHVTVPWVHEGVSDALASEFGAKADLNTFAFGPAIEKISGADRGFEHQGGYMRSSQNVAQHSLKNYETSAKAVKPVPILLLGRIKPTNLEIIGERLKKHQGRHLKEALSKLHPQDLQKVYQDFLGTLNVEEKYHTERYQQTFELLDQFNQLFKGRLAQAGYSEGQILAWLTTASHYPSYVRHNRYLFKTLQDPMTVAQVMVEISENSDPKLGDPRMAFFRNMSEGLFGEAAVSPPVDTFLGLLRDYLYDESANHLDGRIPVNRDTILEIVSKLSVLNLYSNEQSNLGHVLLSYIENTFYNTATEVKEEIDVSHITGFLDEAKERGIKLEGWITGGLVGLAGDHLHALKRGSEEGSIEVQNYQKIVDVLKDYFGLSEWQPFSDINQEIDAFFQNLSNERAYADWTNRISLFFGNLRRTFKHQELDDASREKFIKYLSDKFDNWSGFNKYSVRDILESNQVIEARGQNIDPEENAELAKLQIKTVLALILFQQDGDEFYRFLEDTINSSSVDLSSFSKVGLANLCSPLFLAFKDSIPYNGFWVYHPEAPHMSVRASFGNLRITNFDRLANVSLVSEFLGREEAVDLSSWEKLRTSVLGLVGRLGANSYEACDFPDRSSSASPKEQYDIFSDNALALILFSQHRQAFLNLLSQEITEADLKPLTEVITTLYPAETGRDNFLRAIQKRLLQSKNISLEDKTEYLLDNLESLGPEGVWMVADQITTLVDYQKFREKLGDKLVTYLEGGGVVLKAMAADLVTSLLSEGFDRVIQTTIDDSEVAKKGSTEFATLWFLRNLNLVNLEHIGRARYDREGQKFITGEKSRGAFRSINDVFSILRNFTPTQRLLTLHKSLADVTGGLSSPKRREKLAGLVSKALKLKPGFVADIIQTTCLIGEPRLISFPAANMLSPMLFQNFAVGNIDYAELLKYHSSELDEKTDDGFSKRLDWKDFLTEQEARRIASSTTRQLTVFGARFISQPDSYFYTNAQQSDGIYYQVRNNLERQLFEETNGHIVDAEDENGPKVNPAIDAIIQGVEMSGALGVRSLQLATQLLKFSPEVERRLSRSLDANPGRGKLAFWERLYDESQKDPALLALLSTLEIGDYLGGGSLFTTYAATRFDANGRRKEIVVKALNANAIGFVEQYYSLAAAVLSRVERHRGNSSFAKVAKLLLGVSRDWCQADVEDPDFVTDDDNFASVIQAFNMAAGREVFHAPQREFTSKDIKAEDLANGPTLNKLLKSNRVSPEQKKEIVATLMKFFAFQFKFALTDSQERQFYQFHSDPHLGNYIALDTENLSLSVIDRSMYLKIQQEDVDLLQGLVRGTNSTKFVNQFITRVLDIRGVTSKVQRRAIWLQTWSALGRELGSQVINGKIDNFLLLRTLFNQLDSFGLDKSKGPNEPASSVPLNLRLMIRNIAAMKKLAEKYGLKLEDYIT